MNNPNINKRILYVITVAEHGGAQTHVYTLLSHMREHAWVGLVTSSEGWLTQEARALGVPVFLVPTLVKPLSPAKDMQALMTLTRLFRDLQPNLVHLHSSKAGLLGRVAARVAKVATVFTAHGWAFTEGVSSHRRRLAVLSERLVARLASRIISVSDYDTALARQFGVGREHQLVTIHNGINDVSRLKVAGEGQNELLGNIAMRVLMVARFSLQKDHSTLLQAVAKVPNIQLSLIGDGELLPEAQVLARRLGITNRVEFLGARSDVHRVLAQHDVFALISNYEGFPISILEAMRLGLPVVASDVGGVREAVVNGETGLLVSRGEINALADALIKLSADPISRAQMGQAGRRRFKTLFTLEIMLEKTMQVYEEAMRDYGGRK